MRRRSDRVDLLLARISATVLAVACLAAPTVTFAQNLPSTSASGVPANAFPAEPPAIVIGRSLISVSDKTRQAYRDPADGAVCAAPESISAALGATFTTDVRGNKAYFLNNETGRTVTVSLRTPPGGSDARGSFVPIVELAEALGGKCEFDPKSDTLYIRSVLVSAEMLGSQFRVRGTLPLWPKITRLDGGNVVVFDFPGAEIGTLPKTLANLGPDVTKGRSGQFDDNTARIVLELGTTKTYSWLAPSQPSTLAIISSAPGTENAATVAVAPGTTDATQGESAPIAQAAAPVSITMGSNGAPLPAQPTVTSAVPVGKPAVPTLIKGVRFVRVSDTDARIIVDASNSLPVRTLLTRARLTLDIANSFFGPGLSTTMPEAQHPLLRGVQAVNTSATTAQLMIDLSRAVNYTVRLEPSGGFTIDLTLPKGAGGRIAGKLIVVDAGHGGFDTGAHGINGTLEKDVNLAIARQVTNELHDRGANVIMTRDSDHFVTLPERSNIANRTGADLFVSIHSDEAGHSANGSTVYYHMSDPSEHTLAQCVADRFRDMGGIRTYGSRSDNSMYTSGFSVLRRTSTLAILCECGYMSNSHDVGLLNDSSMQAKIAHSIAAGIQDYIEGNPQSASSRQHNSPAALPATIIPVKAPPAGDASPADNDNEDPPAPSDTQK